MELFYDRGGRRIDQEKWKFAYPSQSSTTIFEETPCRHTRNEENYRPPPVLEAETIPLGDLVAALAEVLAANFPQEQSTLEREVFRLHLVSPSTKLERSYYVALAHYNNRQTDLLRAPVPQFSVLRDCIQRKTMEASGLPEFLVYLLIETVVIDLLVPPTSFPLTSLPPPTGPCWSYQPGGVPDDHTRSTQATKVLTFATHFRLEQQARVILPRLQYFESIQERNETTAQVIQQWKNVWTQVQSTVGLQPMGHQGHEMVANINLSPHSFKKPLV